MPDRDGEQGRFLQELKRSRAAEFRSEIVPYFRYVLQSGFGLLVSALLFAGIMGYIHLLDEVPASYPVGVLGTLAIALAAVRAPLRTYLRPADPVFLLPMERAVLQTYLRPAVQRSIQAGVFRVLAVYLIFVPIYERAPVTQAAASGRPLWLLGAAFAALGAWNALAAWQERRMVYPSRRFTLRLLRWAASLISVGALLLGPLMPAIVVSLLLLAIDTLGWRLTQRYALPWSRLIAEEEALLRGWNRFLSWFVDVPSGGSRPANRRWAAWIADRLPWNRQSAWLYLTAKTFIRGDTFGTLLRWYLVIGFIVIIVSGQPAAVWTAFAVGFWAGGIQLTELGSQPWALSAYTLPIEPHAWRPAAARVAWIAGCTLTLLLWLTACLSDGRPPTWLDAAALAAGLLWHGWRLPRKIAKSRNDEDDD